MTTGFLTDHGAAVKCGRIDEIPLQVQRLLEDAKARRQLSEHALALGKPRSGIDAAERVIAITGL